MSVNNEKDRSEAFNQKRIYDGRDHHENRGHGDHKNHNIKSNKQHGGQENHIKDNQEIWDQIKGMARAVWGGALSDDDFKKAECSVEKLYAVIQEKFDETKETIKKKLEKIYLPSSRTETKE